LASVKQSIGLACLLLFCVAPAAVFSQDAIREDTEYEDDSDYYDDSEPSGGGFDEPNDDAYQEFIQSRCDSSGCDVGPGTGEASSCRIYDFWLSAIATFPEGSEGWEYNCKQLNDDLISMGEAPCQCD
jgi:hypothetical protein